MVNWIVWNRSDYLFKIGFGFDRAQSGASIPGQSGPGSNGNEGVLHIPQSSSITGTYEGWYAIKPQRPTNKLSHHMW